MVDPRFLDDLSCRLAASVPGEFEMLGQDLKRNLKSGAQAMLGRMQLVRRDEFDAQVGVLARTREELDALETRIAELEALVERLEARQAPGD